MFAKLQNMFIVLQAYFAQYYQSVSGSLGPLLTNLRDDILDINPRIIAAFCSDVLGRLVNYDECEGLLYHAHKCLWYMQASAFIVKESVVFAVLILITFSVWFFSSIGVGLVLAFSYASLIISLEYFRKRHMFYCVSHFGRFGKRILLIAILYFGLAYGYKKGKEYLKGKNEECIKEADAFITKCGEVGYWSLVAELIGVPATSVAQCMKMLSLWKVGHTLNGDFLGIHGHVCDIFNCVWEWVSPVPIGTFSFRIRSSRYNRIERLVGFCWYYPFFRSIFKAFWAGNIYSKLRMAFGGLLGVSQWFGPSMAMGPCAASPPTFVSGGLLQEGDGTFDHDTQSSQLSAFCADAEGRGGDMYHSDAPPPYDYSDGSGISTKAAVMAVCVGTVVTTVLYKIGSRFVRFTYKSGSSEENVVRDIKIGEEYVPQVVGKNLVKEGSKKGKGKNKGRARFGRGQAFNKARKVSLKQLGSMYANEEFEVYDKYQDEWLTVRGADLRADYHKYTDETGGLDITFRNTGHSAYASDDFYEGGAEVKKERSKTADSAEPVKESALGKSTINLGKLHQCRIEGKGGKAVAPILNNHIIVLDHLVKGGNGFTLRYKWQGEVSEKKCLVRDLIKTDNPEIWLLPKAAAGCVMKSTRAGLLRVVSEEKPIHGDGNIVYLTEDFETCVSPGQVAHTGKHTGHTQPGYCGSFVVYQGESSSAIVGFHCYGESAKGGANGYLPISDKLRTSLMTGQPDFR